MYAVLRGICAYHFWDCDASYSDKIYNSVRCLLLYVRVLEQRYFLCARCPCTIR